jgi:hypothetical protein
VTVLDAAALARGRACRGEDDVFKSCFMRLIDLARPADRVDGPVS